MSDGGIVVGGRRRRARRARGDGMDAWGEGKDAWGENGGFYGTKVTRKGVSRIVKARKTNAKRQGKLYRKLLSLLGEERARNFEDMEQEDPTRHSLSAIKKGAIEYYGLPKPVRARKPKVTQAQVAQVLEAIAPVAPAEVAQVVEAIAPVAPVVAQKMGWKAYMTSHKGQQHKVKELAQMYRDYKQGLRADGEGFHRSLTPYQKFVKQHRLQGYSMQQIGQMWRS